MKGNSALSRFKKSNRSFFKSDIFRSRSIFSQMRQTPRSIYHFEINLRFGVVDASKKMNTFTKSIFYHSLKILKNVTVVFLSHYLIWVSYGWRIESTLAMLIYLLSLVNFTVVQGEVRYPVWKIHTRNVGKKHKKFYIRVENLITRQLYTFFF